MFGLGFRALTSGDHIFDKREIINHLAKKPRISRAASYPVGTPGVGHYLFDMKNGTSVGIVNLMGRVLKDSIGYP